MGTQQIAHISVPVLIIVVDSTETERQERAFTLGLAGLLGEGVYNFGELVGFPI